MAAPADQILVMNPGNDTSYMKCTYRALELGPLASSTFDNIVQADFRVTNVLTLGLARHRAWCSVSAAVSIHAIAVVVCEAPMCARSTTLEA